MVVRRSLFTMAAKRRTRGLRGAGTITKTSSRRWRLRVPIDGRQVTYGTYETESEAADAQARWRLTHRLPIDEVEHGADGPVSVGDGGMHCNEWFGRWQEAKKARRSRVRVNNKRGGAESTAAQGPGLLVEVVDTDDRSATAAHGHPA